MIGIKLNKELESTYTLLEEIGSGGGGTVYKAYHKRLEKEVVLKKIHSNLTGGNIRAETDILKNLKSEYLPQVLDFFELDGDVYTVMDFIPGRSLKICLKEEGKFQQNQVLKWLDQLCEAVEKLHAQKPPIIHGDIKPDNIMLTPENNICLIDFNVSGDFENDDVAGYTAGYAAPEQVNSFKARKARKAAASAQRRAQEADSANAARTDSGKVAQAGNWNAAKANQEGAAKTNREAAAKANQEDATEVDWEDATEVDREDATEVDWEDATEVDREDATEVDSEDATEIDREDATEVDSGDATEADREAAAGPAREYAAGSGGNAAETDAKLTEEYPHILVDTRSDIYSIGATVYHLLTGERPGTDQIKPVWEYPLKLEGAFAYLIMKCLEKDPKKRFQSVADLHNAVRNIHKSGKRYRALLRRQFFTRLALAAGVVGFAALAAFGHVRMQEEKQEKYLDLVRQEKDAREEGDYDGVLSRYQDATSLFPERGEAYLEVSLFLYQRKRYEEVATFTRNEIENNVTETETLGELYYVYGNSCLELEDYSTAVDAFEKAIGFQSTDAQYYQDYAIALARAGKADEALEELEQAVKYGLGNDGLYYTRGEIAYARGELDAALDSFSESIAVTTDDYRKMRAYLMCSIILGEQELTEERVSEDIGLLNKAVGELPREYSNVLLERLAQAYIDMGELTGDGQYDMQALNVFERIGEYGWATYTTYHNMAVLCQKNGMYEQGMAYLESMLEQFGDNYNTYKRMAFMEAAMQSQIPSENRSYGKFAEYYKTAMELYQKQLTGNQTDPEIISLQNLYDQALQGGWIEE